MEKEIENNPLEWKTEGYYFGSAAWPTDTTYRRCGERIQQRSELSIPRERNAMHHLYDLQSVDFTDFVAQHEDCKILVAESYQTSGGVVDPQIWVIGWKELITPEELQQYEEDRTIGKPMRSGDTD